MTEQSLKWVQDQVKYTGFGDALEIPIRDHIAKGEKEFHVDYRPEMSGTDAETRLYFRQSDKGNYFFNKWDATVARKEGEPLKQTFYVQAPEKGFVVGPDGARAEEKWVNSSITLKEGLNLLTEPDVAQRSVLKNFVKKDGEIYAARITLDLKETDRFGNYPIKKHGDFDIEEKLRSGQVKIKELDNPDAAKQFLDSLNKGNRQSATLVYHDQEYPRTVLVNAQFKTLNFYEPGSNVRQSASQTIAKDIARDQKMDHTQAEATANEVKQKGTRNKKSPSGDDGDEPSAEKKTAKKRSQRVG